MHLKRRGRVWYSVTAGIRNIQYSMCGVMRDIICILMMWYWYCISQYVCSWWLAFVKCVTVNPWYYYFWSILQCGLDVLGWHSHYSVMHFVFYSFWPWCNVIVCKWLYSLACACYSDIDRWHDVVLCLCRLISLNVAASASQLMAGVAGLSYGNARWLFNGGLVAIPVWSGWLNLQLRNVWERSLFSDPLILMTLSIDDDVWKWRRLSNTVHAVSVLSSWLCKYSYLLCYCWLTNIQYY